MTTTVSERPVCRVCGAVLGDVAAFDPDKPAGMPISYLHPECARQASHDAAARRAAERQRLADVAPELLLLLEETAAWVDERVAVLDKLFEPLASRHLGRLRIELVKMRGRATLLRHLAARAKG